jgi:nudix-type nucleoside diphosphatase (YffH/AdpP family)
MGRAALAVSADFFFWGTLCHPALLAAVLGRAVAVQPARLTGHAAHWAAGTDYPLLVPRAGAAAEGVLVAGLDATDVARLDFYEGAFAFGTQAMAVETAAGPRIAQVYVAPAGGPGPGAPWSLDDWARVWGPTVVATAGDVMALFGRRDAAAVAARRDLMLVRGAARVRAAAEPAPATLRRGPAAVRVADRREPYARFFAVEEYDLAPPRFAGGEGRVVTRAAFVSGDAVTVLPWDPVRDRVMLVEQFRAGPFARGDRNPWSLEAVAGRIDPGETPEDTAQREAVEEAGLTLGRLHFVAGYYPSPGAKTEYLYSYVAEADLPDTAPRLGGLPGEGEDIRAHVIPLARLLDLVASGEIANAPLILTAMWLSREKARLAAGRDAPGAA